MREKEGINDKETKEKSMKEKEGNRSVSKETKDTYWKRKMERNVKGKQEVAC